jgi:hypothetical protein
MAGVFDQALFDGAVFDTGAAWTFIGGISKAGDITSLIRAVTAGNLLLCFVVDGNSGSSTPTVADNAAGGSNIWTRIDIYNDPTDATTVVWFWAIAKATETLTLTISGTSSSTIFQTNALGEWHNNTGTIPAAPLDGHVVKTRTAGSVATDGDVTGNLTSAVDGDLIVGWIVDLAADAAQSFAAGTGFVGRPPITVPSTASFEGFQVEDETQVTHGAVQATWTATAADLYSAMAAAFKPPPSGPSATLFAQSIF